MDKRLLKVGLSYLYPSTLELKVWSLRGGSFSISWSAIDWRISSLKCLWQRHKNWNELEMNLPSPPCNYSCGKFSALHRRAIYIQKKSGYEASGDIALTKIQTLIFMKLYAVYTLKIYATIKDSSFEYYYFRFSDLIAMMWEKRVWNNDFAHDPILSRHYNVLGTFHCQFSLWLHSSV